MGFFQVFSWLLRFFQVFSWLLGFFGFSVGIVQFQLAFEIVQVFQLAFEIFQVFSFGFVIESSVVTRLLFVASRRGAAYAVFRRVIISLSPMFRKSLFQA